MRRIPARAIISGPGHSDRCFDSTIKSMRALFPGARLGNCLRLRDQQLPEN